MNNVILETSYPSDDVILEKDYTIELVSNDNEILYIYNFNFPLEIFFDPFPECFDEQTLEFVHENCPDFVAHRTYTESTVFLNVPYSPAGEKINIYDEIGIRVLSFDVSGVACGNDVCDLVETVSSCPQDCQEEREPPTAQDNWFYVYVIFGAIIVVIVVLIMISRMGNKTPKQRQVDRLYRKARRAY
ncbi:MAG: hypothetical protein ABIJ92_04680 [Candidatus Aenigmatarchaeota archaeon]